MMIRPTPKQKAPELNFKLTDGTHWVLNEQKSKNFTLLSFYRGLHCPVCKKRLQQLQELKPNFEKQGIIVVAVSKDSEIRAKKTKQEWNLKDLRPGYDLTLELAKKWGLYN